MKVTKRQLRRIIREERAKALAEQIATVNKDAIEDVVMGVLSDEGGAAGLEPIEDALEELEDEDVSLPDDPIEDVINSVTGVKRHADGDYIDTTKLESRRMKVTKRQLVQIIKEEKARLLKEMHPRAAADNAYLEVLEARDELMTELRRTNLGVDMGKEDDEIYIMTGAAEGITVKVMRRGR